MGCKVLYRSIRFFIIVKKIQFLYPFMTTQEKRWNLESYFWDSMAVKEKIRNLRSSSFKIHGSIVMLNWTQNQDYLLVFSWCNQVFWILGSHESNGSSGLQFGVQMKEI